MAPETDDGFREIQLTGKQLVFLFMAATVVSVVIFLCGVLVGRGVRTDGLVRIDEEASAHPSSEIAARPLRENQTSVPLPALPAVGAAAPAPPPVSELVDEPKAVTPTPAPVPPAEERRPAAPPSASASSSPPLRGAAPPAAPPVDPKPTVPPVPPPTPATAAVAPPVSTPAAPATRSSATATSTARPTPPPSGPGGYQVQVAAYKARSQADEYVKRLATKGFKAYVGTAPDGSFRVRVGPFPNRADANAMAARIEKSEGITPWVSRE